MTFRRALFSAILRRALQGSMTVGYYDRRSRTFADEPLGRVLERCAGSALEIRAELAGSAHPVMIAGTNPKSLWEGYLASVLAGGVPVLLPIRPAFDGASEVERTLAAAESCLPKPRLMLQVTEGQPCIDPGDRAWISFPSDALADPLHALDMVESRPTDPLHLQFTSGSTGDFKPVVLTHQNIASSTSALVDRMGLTRGDHIVSWLPLYHDMGLVGMALAALAAGANLRLLSPFDFLADPRHWLEALGSSAGSVTAAPNFAFDYACRRADISASSEPDLANVKKMYCGSEPVDSATISRFLHRFAHAGLRPEVVHPTYGLAEATLMVTMPRSGEAPKQLTVATEEISTSGPIHPRAASSMRDYQPDGEASRTSVACLGPAADGVTIEIRDDDGRAVTVEDFCGEVVVAGDCVSPGYLKPDGTMSSFDGRCHTGDIGFIHGRELYLVERRRNILIRNGQNYSAAAFERHLAHRLDISLDSCAVLQVDLLQETIVAVVEASRQLPASQLISAAKAASIDIALPIDQVIVVKRNQIPKTTSGKKQHVRLRTLLRAGQIHVIERIDVRAPDTEIVLDEPATADGRHAGSNGVGEVITLVPTTKAVSVMADVVERFARRSGWQGNELTESLRLEADLGLDSLTLIEMAVDVERETLIPIGETQLADLETFGDLVALLESYGQCRSEGAMGIAEAIEQLTSDIPQVYRQVQEQRQRRLLIDGRWCLDFAGVNYLGLDLDVEVAASIEPMVSQWGVHPSWTRAVASPAPYVELESCLAALIGAPSTMVFSTITLAHLGLMPLLATGADTVVLDRAAHNSVAEGAELAVARGASLQRFDHRDLTTLESALRNSRGRPLVAINGVYSMTGTIADLEAIVSMTRSHGGLVYIDDAHGIGVLGRKTDEHHGYGRGGSGVVAMHDLGYQDIVYVAGLSKAFSSMAAFVSCQDEQQRALFERASTSIFSGPIPVASLASALAGLRVNQREGDRLRSQLYRLTKRVIDGATDMGFPIVNPLTFPIVNIPIGDVTTTVAASKAMWRHGVLFTPSVFPAVSLNDGGFRLSLTASHTDADVDLLLDGLKSVIPLVEDQYSSVAGTL